MFYPLLEEFFDNLPFRGSYGTRREKFSPLLDLRHVQDLVQRARKETSESRFHSPGSLPGQGPQRHGRREHGSHGHSGREHSGHGHGGQHRDFEQWGNARWEGSPYGRGRGHRRGHDGRERRHYDLRAALLTLLAEEPLHGYELMRRISERTGGSWRPSPGSIYPALAKLREEGFVEIEHRDGRKTAALSAQGKAHVEEFSEELCAVWQGSNVEDPAREIRSEFRRWEGAIQQIILQGEPELTSQAVRILGKARRSLYELLSSETSHDPSPETI